MATEVVIRRHEKPFGTIRPYPEANNAHAALATQRDQAQKADAG